MNGGKYRQYVVYLKDIGTNKVTRHRVKAADRELAMRSFSDRGLHTIGAVELRIHLLRMLGILLALGLVAWGIIWGMLRLIQEIRFYFY